MDLGNVAVFNEVSLTVLNAAVCDEVPFNIFFAVSAKVVASGKLFPGKNGAFIKWYIPESWNTTRLLKRRKKNKTFKLLRRRSCLFIILSLFSFEGKIALLPSSGCYGSKIRGYFQARHFKVVLAQSFDERKFLAAEELVVICLVNIVVRSETPWLCFEGILNNLGKLLVKARRGSTI